MRDAALGNENIIRFIKALQPWHSPLTSLVSRADLIRGVLVKLTPKKGLTVQVKRHRERYRSITWFGKQNAYGFRASSSEQLRKFRASLGR
jgi:hypothetical protein